MEGRKNEPIFGSGVQLVTMLATQDSIGLSSEGSGGWGPGHNRLQYSSSWELEENTIYKEYIKNILEK